MRRSPLLVSVPLAVISGPTILNAAVDYETSTTTNTPKTETVADKLRATVLSHSSSVFVIQLQTFEFFRIYSNRMNESDDQSVEKQEAVQHLEVALEAEEIDEANCHLREAFQLINVEYFTLFLSETV